MRWLQELLTAHLVKDKKFDKAKRATYDTKIRN